MQKTKVLFVGSFVAKTKDESTGGQTFASLSLINSDLKKTIAWIPLDTTASTNQKRSFLERSINGFFRLFKFFFNLVIHQPKYVLLFASYGWSFKEKGWMAKIAKLLNKKVIFAPRSGLIKKDIESDSSFIKTIQSTLNNTDYLICQSQAWKIFYSNYNINKDLSFKIINNWLNLDYYNNIISTSDPGSKFKVLFLGWVTKNKGVFDLLEAYKRIEDKSIELYIGGNGDAYDHVAKLIAQNNLTENVFLLDWVHGEDKIKLLSKADLFVLPSYQEGYPNALLEGMASGIPTLASNIDSISDFIKHKTNGYLFKPGDSEGLANGILWYKENPQLKKEIIDNARNTILQRNTIDIAVKKFEEIFSE